MFGGDPFERFLIGDIYAKRLVVRLLSLVWQCRIAALLAHWNVITTCRQWKKSAHCSFFMLVPRLFPTLISGKFLVLEGC